MKYELIICTTTAISILLFLYIIFRDNHDTYKTKKSCMCSRMPENYTYNENQPNVGVKGIPLTLNAYNNFDPAKPVETYRSAYSHPARQNPTTNAAFAGV